MNDRDKLVRLPDMVITIDRSPNGDYVIKMPGRGQFWTENYDAMLDVVIEWIEVQNQYITQWKNQQADK